VNGFDLFCLLLVLAFAVWGSIRGFFRQIFGLIGFVGGIVLARLLAPSFGEAFGKDLGLPVAVATAAMAIALFLVMEIVAKLVGRFLHKRMTGGFTKTVERGGGFLLGSAKGLLVAWAFASLIALVRPHLQHMESETSLAKLELGQSHVLNVAREVNLITELRGPRKT
jgi:membrane protein required for colicin V production